MKKKINYYKVAKAIDARIEAKAKHEGITYLEALQALHETRPDLFRGYQRIGHLTKFGRTKLEKKVK